MDVLKVSKWFTLAEFTKSTKATILGIDNTPNEAIISNIKFFASNCLDKVRDVFGLPVVIWSGYRCKLLNKAVGGSVGSDHMRGLAADFKIKGYTVREAIAKIVAAGIEFDQLIMEFDSWVHISMRPGGNRKQILLYLTDKYGNVSRRTITREEALSWAKAV